MTRCTCVDGDAFSLLQVQRLAAQVVASGEEQAKLRGALSAARDQVAQLQSNPPILVSPGNRDIAFQRSVQA